MKSPPLPEPLYPLKLRIRCLAITGEPEEHGHGIMQNVLSRTGAKVRLRPATLQRTFKRLIDKQVIDESEERLVPELDNVRCRDNRLTQLAHRLLAAQSQRLEDLFRVIRVKPGIGSQRTES